MTEFDVGARLKQVREESSLSQRELASQAGVTNGLISLIERNRTSPSISSLKRILAVFGMSLSEFFDSGTQSPDAFVFRKGDLDEINPARVYAGDKEPQGLSLRRVGAGKRDSLLLMLRETYDPGADTGEPYAHEGEEAGLVISGEIELTVGDRTETLRAGDAYQFASTLPHRFRNTADTPCVLVSACTPPTF